MRPGRSPDAFELGDVSRQRDRSGGSYCEVLRVPALSVGVCQLRARGQDMQSPHAEDEAYYLGSIRATISVAVEDREARAGP